MEAIMSGVTIEQARPSDAIDILAVQRLAYQREALLYADDTLPPLTESLRDVELAFSSSTVLKAVIDQRIVGSVRGRQEDGTCQVSRLMVHPEMQGRGIGAMLMTSLEAYFPNTGRFELFTGSLSAGNLRLYRRLGYTECRREDISAGLSLVYLDKANTQNGRSS